MAEIREVTRRFVLQVGFSCPWRCRFCLTGDSKVLTEDFIWEPIRNIKIGDVLIGFTKKKMLTKTIVTYNFRRKEKVYEIATDRGIIKATKDHLFLNRKGKWVETGELKPETYRGAIRFISSPIRFKDNNEYKRGYIAGLLKGDGSIGKSIQKNRWVCRWCSLRMRDLEAIKRYQEYLAHFGISINIGNIYQTYKKQKYMMYRIECRDADRINKIKRLLLSKDGKDFARGFLAGIFDAEGSIGKKRICRIASCSSETKKMIIRFGKLLGFKFKMEKESVRLTGGIGAIINFLALTNPAIKRKKDECLNISKTSKNAIVLDVKDAGIETVFNLETTTGTYWVNGFASHNCYYRESLKKGKVKDFTTEEVKEKLREGRRLGKDQTDISGGEPSIRKDLFEIIRYARKIGYKKVCMITNCFRTHDMNYVNNLIDAGLNDVLLSLHSPIEKEHDWLTQVPGSWKKVMKSLENFSKTKIEYRVNSTISDVNYKKMDLFFKLIKPYNPHAYNLLVLNPTQESEVKEDESLKIVNYNEIGKEIGKAIRKYKKDFNTINVRWIPFCMLKGNEEHVRTRWQKLYEDQEWDPYLNIKYNKGWWAAIGSAAAGLFLYPIYAPRYGKRGLYTKFNEMITTFRVKLYHRQLNECKQCSLRKICDALPANYVKTFNKTKLEPYKLGKVVKDPLYFCKEYKENFRSLRISKR